MFTPTKMMVPFPARQKLGDLLVAFSNSPFPFHLAGSYFFKVARPTSDVDLYAPYSVDLVAFLRSHGFFELGAANDEKYPDIVQGSALADATSNTVAVYGHASKEVHVQVFHDLPLALKTRDILAGAFNAEHTRTRGPNRGAMWRAAERAAREILSLAIPA